jgi:hypothetical protein
MGNGNLSIRYPDFFMCTVFVDILDIWVVPKIIKYANRKEKVYYIAGSGKVSEIFVKRLLKAIGYRTERVESVFERNLSPNCHVEFHKKLNQLFKTIVYIKAGEQIDSIHHIPFCQRDRMITALMLNGYNTLRREFELIESVKTYDFFLQKMKCVVLLHSTFSADCLKSFVTKGDLCILTYLAPFRKKIREREGSYTDELYVVRSMTHELLKACSFFVKYIRTLLLVCCNSVVCFLSKDEQRRTAGNFDFLAVLHLHHTRRDEYNELYWLEDLRKKRELKVLGVVSCGFNEEVYQYYKEKTEALLSEKKLLSLIDFKMYIQLSSSWCYKIIYAFITRKIRLCTAVYLTELMERTSFFEALFGHTGIRYVWNMGETHSSVSIASALAVSRAAGVSFGSTWSMHYYPAPLIKYNRNDIIFLSGNRQVDMLSASDAHVKRYILTGYQTVRHSFQTKADNKNGKPEWLLSSLEKGKKTKVITFYDNAAFFKDDIPSPEEMNQLYRHLLVWVKNNPEYLLILKAKREKYLRYLWKEELSLVEDLKATGGLVVRQKHADLTAGLVADIVVGCSATGLLLLSSAFGRPAVLLDQHNLFTHWPANIPNLTIIDNPADIGEAIQKSLESTTFMSKNSGGNIDAFSDLDGDIRTASYINSLMEALSEGKNIDTTIEFADREYTRNWGLDKVRLRDGEPVTVA